MTKNTEAAVVAVCMADGTIKRADIRAAIDLLRGAGRGAAGEEADTALTRGEVARMLRVSKSTVSDWAMRGIIRRMTIAGRRKAVGYSRRSVLNILNGEGA